MTSSNKALSTNISEKQGEHLRTDLKTFHLDWQIKETYCTLYWISDLCIPRNETVPLRFQFLHSCIYEQITYCQDQSAYFWLQQNRQTDPGKIEIAHRYMNVQIWETEHYNYVLEVTRLRNFISGYTNIGFRHLYRILTGPFIFSVAFRIFWVYKRSSYKELKLLQE